MPTKIKSLKDIEAHKALLKQSIAINEEKLGGAYVRSRHELPKFVLKKAILPSALVAFASAGLNQIAKKNTDQATTYASSSEQKSFWQSIWNFAFPILQKQLSNYLKQKS